MQTVKIGELKAQLSAYLQRVQDGEEVLVCDRSKPVARIVPVGMNERSDRERRLIARGILVPAAEKKPRSWPQPPGNVSRELMERVWREEREDG